LGSPPKRTFIVFVGFLEVVVAFVGFLLAFLVVRRPWDWGIFECSPELVALLSGVVALQMPQTLLF
jgi:predicted Co/Zn/Cd cation transporter (cation efflux family)